MRALVWNGINDLRVETVPDPAIVNPHDAILRVTATTTCGSDLHFIDGYVPGMREGDVIGHEFMGEVVEVGPDVTKVRPGARVVVPSFIGCGSCWFCRQELWSLCDNTNPKHELQEPVMGYPTAGIYGYTHAFGGYAGSHAEYVRVPHADNDCFHVPDGLSDEQALFFSDAGPTGYMGAEFCDLRGGEVVAVWGAGPVGQFAAASAYLLGAERVIAIDRFPYRLQMAREKAGAITINYEEVDSVPDVLNDITAGRGPDHCIDAVGVEGHTHGVQYVHDRAKQILRMQTDRPIALREAVLSCRSGGTVSVIGVYTGLIDKFPMNAVMNRSLTIKTGQTHVHRYMRPLLERIERGELDPTFIITHRLRLDQAAEGYETFGSKDEGCMKVVLAASA